MNKENLTHTLTVEEQRKGGIRSGEVRRERRKLKEELDVLLSRKDLQRDICQALIEKALSGDIRAFAMIRDTLGETVRTLAIHPEPDHVEFEVMFNREDGKISNLLSEKHIHNIELMKENRELKHRLENLAAELEEIKEKNKPKEKPKKEKIKAISFTDY